MSRADRKTGRAKPDGIFGGAGNSWPSRRARSVTPKRRTPGSTDLTSGRLCPTVTGGSRPGPFPGGSGVVPPPRTQGTFTIRAPLWVPPLRVLLRPCHFNEETIAPNRGPVKRQSGQKEKEKTGKLIFTVYSQYIHDLALFTGYDTDRFRDESKQETILPNQFLSYPSPTPLQHTQHTPKKPRPYGRGFLVLSGQKERTGLYRSSRIGGSYLPG